MPFGFGLEKDCSASYHNVMGFFTLEKGNMFLFLCFGV